MQVSAIFYEISNIYKLPETINTRENRYSSFVFSEKSGKDSENIYDLINAWKAFCIKQLKKQENINYSA